MNTCPAINCIRQTKDKIKASKSSWTIERTCRKEYKETPECPFFDTYKRKANAHS